jgi:chemotaxis protein CheD
MSIATPTVMPRPDPSRLNALKAKPRQPGEASFFFYDAFFNNDAVKIVPCEYFVHAEDSLMMTTLGSCVPLASGTATPGSAA